MKLFIPIFGLAIILCQAVNSSPVPTYQANEQRLQDLDNDPNRPISSSEVMPGRHLTSKEIQNLIYLARADAGVEPWSPSEDKKKITTRTKRFIFRRSAMRREERLKRRQERLRQRNERRRLRLERQRLRQEAQLQRLSNQNSITKQALNQLTRNNQQQPQKFQNSAIKSAPTTQASVTTAGTSASTTSTASTSTSTTTVATKTKETLPAVLAQTFEQVPLPGGK